MGRANNTSGVVLAANGNYLEARIVRCRGSGGTLAIRYICWGKHDWLRSLAYLHRSIVVGVPCCWQHGQRARFPNGYVQAPGRSVFSVASLQTEMESQREVWRNNCVAIVPDDAYLATLPSVFGVNTPESFVSVYQGERQWTIGLIIGRQLVSVFVMAPADPMSLESHLGRIERYLTLCDPQLRMPRVVFSLGNSKVLPIDSFEIRQLEIPNVLSAERLQAAGLACVPLASMIVPLLADCTSEAGWQVVRKRVSAVASAMVLIVGLAALCFTGLNWWYEERLGRLAARYRRMAAEADGVSTQLKESEMLAAKVEQMRRQMECRTTWTQLLTTLSCDRPDDLYIERVGSSTLNDGRIQIAVAGWAEHERAVTELISRMERKNFLSDVEMKVMEREGKGSNRIRFKVQCTLRFLGE